MNLVTQDVHGKLTLNEQLKELRQQYVNCLLVPTREGRRMGGLYHNAYFLALDAVLDKQNRPCLQVYRVVRESAGLRHPVFKKLFQQFEQRMFTLRGRKQTILLPVDRRIRQATWEDGVRWATEPAPVDRDEPILGEELHVGQAAR